MKGMAGSPGWMGQTAPAVPTVPILGKGLMPGAAHQWGPGAPGACAAAGMTAPGVGMPMGMMGRPMFPLAGPFAMKGGCMMRGPLPGKGFSMVGPDGQPLPPGKGGQLPQADKKRAWSPHAGARAIRESMRTGHSPVPSEKSSQRSKRSKSSSSSRKSSKSRGRTKRRKRGKSSRSSSSSSSSSADKHRGRRRSDSPSKGASAGAAAASALVGNSSDTKEIDEAKKDALAKLMALNSVEPKDERMKQWRSLLREWHPDKNPDKTEVATAVFQFLQKGKRLLKSD